jgi:membrane-anchored protein YejM (alkaline phosphatase superfamily)
LKVYEEYEGYELHEVYESHEGFEPHEVHEDHQGYEDDSQALTATLHVIVSVRMLFSTMSSKTSSVRGHSRPLLQALSWVLISHIQPYHGIAV